MMLPPSGLLTEFQTCLDYWMPVSHRRGLRGCLRPNLSVVSERTGEASVDIEQFQPPRLLQCQADRPWRALARDGDFRPELRGTNSAAQGLERQGVLRNEEQHHLTDGLPVPSASFSGVRRSAR